MSDDAEARGVTTSEALVHGREAFDRRQWADAAAQLSAVDREDPLEPGNPSGSPRRRISSAAMRRASRSGSVRIASS